VALQRATSALADCLERPEGCKVVPGLPLEQYYATLTCSIAGGVVAGLVSRIGPQGGGPGRTVTQCVFAAAVFSTVPFAGCSLFVMVVLDDLCCGHLPVLLRA
jgi:hypothetical protein